MELRAQYIVQTYLTGGALASAYCSFLFVTSTAYVKLLAAPLTRIHVHSRLFLMSSDTASVVSQMYLSAATRIIFLNVVIRLIILASNNFFYF